MSKILKCPYCYEVLKDKVFKCEHCEQFLIDEIIQSDFIGADKKGCVYCGKKVLTEAKICKFCHRWLDEVDRAAGEVDPSDLV